MSFLLGDTVSFPGVINVKSLGATGDGGTDDTTAIQNAITAAANGTYPYKVAYFPPGIYLISSPLSVTGSNIHLIGDGPSASHIKMAASMTGGTSNAINFYNSTVGAEHILTANSALGDRWIKVSAANAATYTAGDWIVIRSLRPAETGSTSKFVGEIRKILTVSASHGALELEGSLSETYLTADSAGIVKVTVIENNRLEGLKISHAAGTAPAIYTPAVVFRNCLNASAYNVGIRDVFYTGIDLYSCIDSTIEKCDIRDVRSSSSLTVYYGIWVSSASRGITIHDCNFARLRHSVTTGTHSNAGVSTLSPDGREGVQRGISMRNNRSWDSTTAHFDWHAPAEAVDMQNNHCFGAWAEGAPDTSVWGGKVYGLQGRADKAIMCGNVIQYCTGGIQLFGDNAQDALVKGNVIRDILAPNYQSILTTATSGGEATINVRDAAGYAASGTVVMGASSVTYTGKGATTLTGCAGVQAATAGSLVKQWNSGGYGIVLDTAATGSGIVIEGNVIVNTDSAAISGNGNQNDVKVYGNYCKANAKRTAIASIKFSTGERIDIQNNTIENNQSGEGPIEITGTLTGNRIIRNNFYNNLDMAPSWAGNETECWGNVGYSRGNNTTPWPLIATGTDLRGNLTGTTGQADPDTAVTYTVRSGPCTILVTGGTVSAIRINSSSVDTGLISGFFKLSVGDTIKITYSSVPTTRIVWE